MARVSQPAQPRPQQIWKGPLIAGLCFGVAYGVTQRLVSFNVAELIRFGPGFDVQVFPGTSLESLKLRFGDAQAEIRGDLDLQELERQQELEAKQRAEEAKQAEAALQQADQSAGFPASDFHWQCLDVARAEVANRLEQVLVRVEGLVQLIQQAQQACLQCGAGQCGCGSST